MKKILLFIFLIVVTVNVQANNDDLKKGWESFKNNSFEEAAAFFKQATKDDASKAEANLALSLISRENGNNQEAFKYFLEFYKYSTNPYPYTLAYGLQDVLMLIIIRKIKTSYLF